MYQRLTPPKYPYNIIHLEQKKIDHFTSIDLRLEIKSIAKKEVFNGPDKSFKTYMVMETKDKTSTRELSILLNRQLSRRCGHEYDCCGCYFTQFFDVKKLRKGRYAVTEHGALNY